MSSTTSDPTPTRAELAFRDAFDRLKRGKPERLSKGARVSQNNVAKEAGVDPSALRRTRFPTLVADIQAWVQQHDSADSAASGVGRTETRTLLQRIVALEAQRDDALAKLVDAEALILSLTLEVEQLRPHAPDLNVTSLRRKPSPR